MVDEKEVTVKIMTEVDDENIVDLEDRLDELNNNQVDLNVTADPSEVDSVESSVEDLETEIETVNNTSVAPPGDSSGVDSVSESVNSLNDLLAGVGAGASLAGMTQLVDTAGNINDSWNRLGLTFGSVTEQMKTDISEAGESTGRSGSLIRGYFNDMGIAGVSNTELLQQSFEALSGRAYQTGNSIEAMEQKMKMMVMSGNAGSRQLTQLGISTADLGRVMGVSADEASKMFQSLSQEERLRVLTQAMGDGRNANEMYKNSWQGLKDQVDRASGALMGTVGNMILPHLVPAMETATRVIESLSNAFKNLPAPIQGIIGGVMAVVMGFLAFTTIVATVRSLATAIQFVSTATQIFSTVAKIAALAQQALNIAMLTNPFTLIAAAIAIIVGLLVYLYTTNEEFRNSVNKLGEDIKRVFQGDFSAIKDIIGDIGKVFDALTKAIFGEELGQKIIDIRHQIEDFIMSIPEALQNLGNFNIVDFIFGDGTTDALNQAFEDLKSGISEGLNLLWEDISNYGVVGFYAFILQLFGIDITPYLDTFRQAVLDFCTNVGQDLYNAFMQIPQGISEMINGTVSTFQGWVGQISGFFNNIISNAANFAGSLAGQMGSAASNAVSSFLSGISNLVSSFMDELSSMLNYVGEWASNLASAMANAAGGAVDSFLGALHIKSPGIMQRKFIGEMDGIVTAATDTEAPLSYAMGNVAESSVNNFNPNFDLSNIRTMGNNSTSGGVVNNFSFSFPGFINDEERLTDLIIRTITDNINWDNETANRTV